MKKLLLSLLLATGLFAADAANDIIMSQRKPDNSGNIQRNVPATGAITSGSLPSFRSAIGLGTGDAVTFANVTDSALTAGRVTYAGTAGLLANSANLTYTDGTTTGQLIHPVGAVGTPSMTFLGDTDNGLYYVTTNHLGMAIGGAVNTRWVGTHTLLGGLTADGTGVLQFPAATTSAGGIAFGTEIFFFRTGTNTATITAGTLTTSGGLNTGGASTFATYGANTLGGAGTTIAPDVNAKFQIGRYNGGVPYAYIKPNSTASGIKFTNGADNLDIMTMDNTGKVTFSTGAMSIAGIGTLGAVIRSQAVSITDTSSSGTVANMMVSILDTPTLTASSATTWTNGYTFYAAQPVASTNVTFTNRWGVGTDGGIKAAGQINGGFYVGTTSTLTGAGAANVTTETTKLTTAGTGDAITLANGVDGQTKILVLDVLTAGGHTSVLTPTTKTGFSTVTFTAAGQSVMLKYVTTRGWMVIGSYGSTIAP